VGHSGSGKSTCINLIMRYYDVQEGEISIDNVNIQKMRKLSLRRQVGLVAQDPFLFRGTISENIAYGNPGVAPQQVLNAALAADAHMFITRNHDGYDTLLGERGAGLSGGERQRVAIARALLNNPRVLILDEATSSVDTIAEREIQKALEALSLGRTTVAIAHRLSTLRNCDRILVFEGGTIKEQGTHDSLIAEGGIYKKLVEIQTQLTSDVESVEGLQAIEDINRREKEKKGVTSRKDQRQRLDIPKIRYLNPKDLRIYAKDEGGMHVEYGEDVFEGVRAYRCFPVSRPSEFIALWTGESAIEHREVGMVRRLKELLPSSRMAVELELAKRYFIHYIQEIKEIKQELSFLIWKVETDKGEMEFMTRYHDRNSVADGAVNGRIILDLDNNRYEIEDLDALDPQSRSTFLKYIYW
jgi:ABC-type multidrug transport system ATPase subunit